MNKNDEQKNMQSLIGKTALITGASRGIGAAAARELATQGVRVALAARTLKDTQSIAQDIIDAGGTAIAIACDVTHYKDVDSAVTETLSALGHIDILVNNAGTIDPIAHIAHSDPDGWDQVVDINLKGVYHGIRAVLPAMLKQRSGTIINISSGAATKPIEGWSHYCASKAAVLSLTACVHKEYTEQGIKCIGLSPGTVATDMQLSIKASGINAISKMDFSSHIPPEWPARAIAWLCTDEAAYLSGTDFSIKTEEGRRKAGLID